MLVTLYRSDLNLIFKLLLGPRGFDYGETDRVYWVLFKILYNNVRTDIAISVVTTQN